MCLPPVPWQFPTLIAILRVHRIVDAQNMLVKLISIVFSVYLPISVALFSARFVPAPVHSQPWVDAFLFEGHGIQFQPLLLQAHYKK